MIRAKPAKVSRYRKRFFVYLAPSEIINAKMGKARRPMSRKISDRGKSKIPAWSQIIAAAAINFNAFPLSMPNLA